MRILKKQKPFLTNLKIKFNDHGIFNNGNDSVFSNLVVTNNTNYGIRLDRMSNRCSVENSDVRFNGIYNIHYDIYDGVCPLNNTITNCCLGNYSKIGSDDWSLTPNFFIGNYYSNYNGGGVLCFDSPLNLTCDSFPKNESDLISNNSIKQVFPFGNLFIGVFMVLVFVVVG